MRSFGDRVRHAVLFELIGLAMFTPMAAIVFNQPIAHMGVIGVVGATVATLWNFIYNLGFDRALMRLRGKVQKTISIRIIHAVIFEAGLVVILIPFIAWYLQITLVEALLMDIAVVTFYLVYAFVFNIVYDWVFPIKARPQPRALPKAIG